MCIVHETLRPTKKFPDGAANPQLVTLLSDKSNQPCHKGINMSLKRLPFCPGIKLITGSKVQQLVLVRDEYSAS